MRQIYNTTELVGIKDKNITLTKVFQYETHLEIAATLDYTHPKYSHCHGKQIKYDFQKPSKLPFIEIGGLPNLIRLKKRRFQCKDCRKVTVSETSLVKKTTIRNHFFKYSKEARERVKITMDMSGNYILLVMLLRSTVSRLRLKQSIPRLFHSQMLKLFLTVFTLSNI